MHFMRIILNYDNKYEETVLYLFREKNITCLNILTVLIIWVKFRYKYQLSCKEKLFYSHQGRHNYEFIYVKDGWIHHSDDYNDKDKENLFDRNLTHKKWT